MGWRAWDAYDKEASERWRAMPWQQRYSLRRVLVFALLVAAAAAIILWTNVARAQDLVGVPRILDGDTTVRMMANAWRKILPRLRTFTPCGG